MQVTFDTIQGSGMSLDGQAGRVSRGVTITGVPTFVDGDPSVLFAARDAIVAAGGGSYPGHSEFLFTKLLLRGFANDALYGQAIYETFQGLLPSLLIVRENSAMSTYRTVRLPGSSLVVKGFWNATAGTPADDSIPDDTIHMELLRPIRSLSVTAAIFAQQAPAAIGDALGSVNDSDWPTTVATPKPAGSFLVAQFSSDTSRFQGYTSYSATVMSRGDDWRELYVLRDRRTGMLAKFDQSQVDSVMSIPYRSDAPQYNGGNGFVVVFPFPVINMAALLGIA